MDNFQHEAEQAAARSSLINCEECRKRLITHFKNLRTMYLFLTAGEGLMDTDGHRINSLVAFVGAMKLRSDASTLCEAIRQIKTSQ